MSSDSRPSVADLASFASKAKEISIGGDDIIDLGDDLGVNLLANQNKVSVNSRATRINLGADVAAPTSSGSNELPNIQIKPVDDLDVINLDAAPGASDIKINREGGSSDVPFVINTGSSDAAAAADVPITHALPHMSQEEELRHKKALLTKLQRLDNSGIGGQRMTLVNSLEDIQAEYEKRTDSRNLEASIRFQRNALMTFVTGVEMVNEKFGGRLPVKPRLKGWSESVHTNIEDFDEIFEELYDMYKDSAKVHPLLRLVGTLGVSATMYHLTNTAAERSGIPGMADVLNDNPELQRQFAAAMMAKMGGGLGNFMAAAGGMPVPMHPGLDQRQPAAVPVAPAPPAAPAPVAPASTTARREMRGPRGVDDILRAFEAERIAAEVPISQQAAGVFVPVGKPPSPPMVPSVMRAGVGTTIDPLAEFMEDMGSVGSGSTMNTERRRGRRRAAPEPVGATLNLNV